MKNVIFTLFNLIVLSLISVNLQKGICETKEVSFGDTIKYDLGFFGDEDRIKILKPAEFNALDGFCSKNREPLIYCYTPTRSLLVNDTIIFRKSTGSDGAGPSNIHKTLILIIKPESEKYKKYPGK